MQRLHGRLQRGRLAEPVLHARLVALHAGRLGRLEHALQRQGVLGARPLALQPRRRLQLAPLLGVPRLVLVR